MARTAAAFLGTGFVTAAVTGALLAGAPAVHASPDDPGSTSSTGESAGESPSDSKPESKPESKPDPEPESAPESESTVGSGDDGEVESPTPPADDSEPIDEPVAQTPDASPKPTRSLPDDDSAPVARSVGAPSTRSAPEASPSAEATTVTGELTAPEPVAAVAEIEPTAAPSAEAAAALTVAEPEPSSPVPAVDEPGSLTGAAPVAVASPPTGLAALALNVLSGLVQLFGGPPVLPASGAARASALPADAGRAVDADWSFPEAGPQAQLAETEAVFTGQPSIFTQVFVTGLRLIKPVLALFGIELNGTSARIPFFTDGVPPFFVTGGLDVRAEEYEGWKVWRLTPPNPTEKVVVGVHGGSFISTASLFHWETYADMARKTGATVVVPLYPLANADGTGGTAKTVVPVVADFIAAQVAEHGAENVSVFGDSAGGSIALAAAQEIVRRCGDDAACRSAQLPGRMVLLSPALDASATNPGIAEIDDPLLSPASSRRNGLWWARGLETVDDPDGTRNPLASPVFGSLEHLPPITVYAGSIDLRTPDVLVLREKALAAGADIAFELRAGQFHDWPIFGFLPDAHVERANIHRDLGLS